MLLWVIQFFTAIVILMIITAGCTYLYVKNTSDTIALIVAIIGFCSIMILIPTVLVIMLVIRPRLRARSNTVPLEVVEDC